MQSNIIFQSNKTKNIRPKTYVIHLGSMLWLSRLPPLWPYNYAAQFLGRKWSIENWNCTEVVLTHKSQRLIYLNQQRIQSARGDPDNSSIESFMHVQKKQRLDVQMILQTLMILRSSQPPREVPNLLFPHRTPACLRAPASPSLLNEDNLSCSTALFITIWKSHKLRSESKSFL